MPRILVAGQPAATRYTAEASSALKNAGFISVECSRPARASACSSALGQVPDDAGLIPLTISQMISVCAIVASGIALSTPWRPRDRHSRLDQDILIATKPLKLREFSEENHG